MRNQILALAALPFLAFVALDAPAAHADPHEAHRDGEIDRHGRVFVRGHYETRIEVVRVPAVIEKRVIPARTVREWVADRYDEVCVPAVVERVFCPPVVERVWCPPVCERVWVPPVTRRVWVAPVVECDRTPARYETSRDALGIERRFCVQVERSVERVVRAGYWETRVESEGRFEERVVRPGRWDERVVREGRWDERVVVPERHERRLVCAGHWVTRVIEPERCVEVVVRPARVERQSCRVWVPGHWQDRRPRA